MARRFRHRRHQRGPRAPDCNAIDTQSTPIPGVVAAGDVARSPNHRFDHEPRRVEHWINAIEMGRHRADTTLDPDSSTSVTPIPRFWSEQHGTRIQAAGIPALADEITITEGTTTTRSSVTTYTREGTLVGVVTINAPRRLQHYTSMIG